MLGHARHLVGTINRLLDYRSPHNSPRIDSAWLGLVYRSRNTPYVERLISSVEDIGWHVHAWALDSVSPPLQSFTRGIGPGGKFELLQQLLDEFPPPPASWVVLADDDFIFRRGSLVDLLAIANDAGLDLSQPAHRRFVNIAHHITLVRPRIVARRTHFVEIGPVVALSPLGRGALLPLPFAKMGWGVEALWSRASLNGELTLGIVDAVTIEHRGRVGASYDVSAALAEQDRFLRQAGLDSLRDVHINVAAWRRHRSRPDWTARSP